MKTSKEKEYRVSSLQFTVFVAEGEVWGTYGHLNTGAYVLFQPAPLLPGTTQVHLTVVRAKGVRN